MNPFKSLSQLAGVFGSADALDNMRKEFVLKIMDASDWGEPSRKKQIDFLTEAGWDFLEALSFVQVAELRTLSEIYNYLVDDIVDDIAGKLRDLKDG